MVQKTVKRFNWLEHMIKHNCYTIGAEIGVANGTTSKYLLRRCSDLHLIAVDKWEKIIPDPEGEKIGCESWDPQRGWFRFNRAIRNFRKRVTILRGDSVEMADKVKDNSLDFVFIDGDHRYKGVLRDIRAWAPKLKEDGALCGHDIHLKGVRKAVEELIPDYREAGVDNVWHATKEDYVD